MMRRVSGEMALKRRTASMPFKPGNSTSTSTTSGRIPAASFSSASSELGKCCEHSRSGTWLSTRATVLRKVWLSSINQTVMGWAGEDFRAGIAAAAVEAPDFFGGVVWVEGISQSKESRMTTGQMNDEIRMTNDERNPKSE